MLGFQVILLAGLFVLAGCKTPEIGALEHSHQGYAEAYGAVNNDQMLLNLARMANGDPAYFIQLGTFSAQYQFNASLGFNPNNVQNSPGFYPSSSSTPVGLTPPTFSSGSISEATSEYTKDALTFGGSAMIGAQASPNFQFLPITGTNLTGFVFNPITDKVFLTLYDQGYSADTLARMMLSEITTSSSDGSPETFENNPYDPTYGRFLDTCDLLRFDQLAGWLVVGPQGEPKPVYSGPVDAIPKMSDVVTAINANLKVSYNSTTKILDISQKQSVGAGFKLGEVGPAVQRLAINNLKGGTMLPSVEYSNTLAMSVPHGTFTEIYSEETNNFEIVPQSEPDKTSTELKAFRLAKSIVAASDSAEQLKTHTVESAMFHAANEERWYRAKAKAMGNPDLKVLLKYDAVLGFEQDLDSPIPGTSTSIRQSLCKNRSLAGCFGSQHEKFEALYDLIATNATAAQVLLNLSGDITFGKDENGPYAVVFRDTGLPLLARPIMLITRDKDEAPFDRVLVELKYGDGSPKHYYCIGDRGESIENRSVFTLLSYLFAQAGVSTQNLPVQQLIQVP